MHKRRVKTSRLFFHGVWPSNQELKRAAPAADAGSASAVDAAATEVIKGEPLLVALHGCTRHLARLRETLLAQVRSGM